MPNTTLYLIKYIPPSLPYGDFFKGYGGDGELELRERISNTLLDIMRREGHDTVLAVSHGAACRQFMINWEHTSDLNQKGRISNCCILKFTFENDTFQLVEIINHDFHEIEEQFH